MRFIVSIIYVSTFALLKAQSPGTLNANDPIRSRVSLPAPGTILPSQSIGSDDLLSISVADCPELSRTFRVSSDGTLSLPLLGHRVSVAGLMPVDVEEKLTKELQNAQILVQPIVSVSVAEYRSKPISVVGAVHHPLTFQAMGDSTLLDAIAKAEGLRPEAGPEVIVTQKQLQANGEIETKIQHVPVRGLIDSADSTLNLKLKGGEEVRVPEIGKIFVTGNVRKPGVFAMQDNADTTLLKALALSEGLLSFSSKQVYVYRRDPATGKRNEVVVELGQILARKSPDIAILADDIVYIPENKGRKLTIDALDRLAGFGSATGSGLLIWHK